MKTPVFWVVAPCSLVKFTDVSEVFAASTAAANTSETPENFYQTTRRSNPEDSHILSSLLAIIFLPHSTLYNFLCSSKPAPLN
jgi:hypothetical protein